MLNDATRSVFGVITDFLATNPTPDEIIAYTLPDDLITHAHNLLERHSNGDLSPEERDEMLDFARIDDMMTLLKAKSKMKL